MNIDELKRKRNNYYKHLIQKKVNLETAKEANAKIDTLKTSHLKIEKLLNVAVTYKSYLTKLHNIAESEDTAFKDRRIKYLDSIITEELAKIFPNNNFKAKITCDFKHNTNKAYLNLVDQLGYVRPPYITEGKLCQYLISYAATVGVIKGLGYHNIFIDEAFGVSSVGNLQKIGKILQHTVEDGIQIILIGQNPVLYSDIARREITLSNNELGTVVDTIIDYEGELIEDEL